MDKQVQKTYRLVEGTGNRYCSASLGEAGPCSLRAEFCIDIETISVSGGG